MKRFFKRISIAYKIHIPLIVISILGLSIIIYNSMLSLEEKELRAKEEIRQELKKYVSNEIHKKTQISLTNAINLSLNQKIIKALEKNDRDLAYGLVQELSQKYENYTGYGKVKIHLHDKEIKSFLRGWKPDVYGDDLKGFRESLLLANSYKKPISALENGRIGMMIRGIAPVFNGEEFLGTVEFMQDFNSIVKRAKNTYNYSVAVFSCDEEADDIPVFNPYIPLNRGDMSLAQDMRITDQKFYKALERSFDRSKMMKEGLLKIENYYVAGISLRNINERQIGCVLIAADEEYVNRYVEESKATLTQLIWFLVLADISMLILLIYLLEITVKKPIVQLRKNLREINKQIGLGKDPNALYQDQKVPYQYHDEVGVISVTVNALLRRMAQNFTALQRSEKNKSEYIKAIYASGLVSVGDAKGDILFVNDELCKTTGYTREELLGQPHNILRDEQTPTKVYEELWNTIRSGKIYKRVLRNKTKDGDIFYANTTIVPIKDDKDKIVEYVAYRDDITELIKSKDKIRQRYSTDPLTKLGNRFKLLEDISENCYLAIVDIHLFREINDYYGHKIGDKVLQGLADRLRDFCQEKDMQSYRLNGDEFAILANNSLSKKEFYIHIKNFLEENREKDYEIDDLFNVSTRLTCGISYNEENLLTSADVAHKYAKSSNKDLLEYTNEINTNVQNEQNIEWTNELKKAVHEGRMTAYYQPIVNAKTGKIEKYETLMRLIKEDGEVVTPIHFLEIAKKTRIYKELTKIVVQHAFDKFSNTEYEFSINLSVEDIMINDIESWIFDLAVEKGVQNRLVIELVESEGIESFDAIDNFIQQAKAHGMKIAIDDFGTGYSNFEYLIKLNTNYLKIDGSLIREIDKDEKLYSVVETIVAFAKKNNIKVIGEFVASEEIYNKIKNLDIDFGQGYFLGTPSEDLL